MTARADDVPEPTHPQGNEAERTRLDGPPTESPTLTGGTFPPISSQVLDFPRRFGKFNLLKLVAIGGMGEVFEAEELEPDGQHSARRVAVKRILAKVVETRAAVERFQRETQAGKRLDHANIVPVYESGDIGGEHYFTMPFVAGGNLSHYVTEERLTPRQAARVVFHIAQAVEYAHSLKTIHRDIKPQNIVLQPVAASSCDGFDDDSHLCFTPRLTDFGLARLVAEESSLSLSAKGEAMGTPGYMPPEQAQGEIDSICPASDVYGLGAVLYALLAGRAPFPLDPPQGALPTLRQVIEREAIPPRKFNPAVPPELEAICLRCLAKAPADRYGSAQQLAEALEDFLAGRPRIRHTRGMGFFSRTGRHLLRATRKHPLAALMILAALGVIGLLAFFLWQMPAWQRLHARKEAEALVARAEKEPPDRAAESLLLATDKYDQVIGQTDPSPGTISLWLARATTRMRRAQMLRADPHAWKLAEGEYAAAIGELERLDDERARPLLADACQGAAETFTATDRPEDHRRALPFYEKALHMRKALSVAAPRDTERLQALARTRGYIGDTYLALGDRDRSLAAYVAASEDRQHVLDLQPEGEELVRALCLRARDFANLANYWERLGKPADALERCRERMAFYDAHLRDRVLPGEFRMERANSLTASAVLLLDTQGKAGASEALGLLDRALREYQRLKTGGADYELGSGIAWAQVSRGKALAIKGEAARSREALASALAFYASLAPATRRLPTNRFRQAIAHAWKDGGEESSYQSRRHLEGAVAAGFDHLPWIQREKGFDHLRQTPWFAALLARIQQGKQ